MRSCTIVCTLDADLSLIEGDVIGVDRGAYNLAKQGISMLCAMGDFDSISASQKELVLKYAKSIEVFNPIKDDTDFEAALHYAKRKRYDKIRVLGALGGRQDHNFLNLLMLYSISDKIELIDDKNRITVLKKGEHTVYKGNYKYCSFFTLNRAVISLEGFFYSLEERTITRNDFYTISNEILDEKGKVTVYSGKILMMQCKD